jgi:hypothetical protein
VITFHRIERSSSTGIPDHFRPEHALLPTDAGKYRWNNPNTGHSGWIDAGAEYVDPGGSKCREIKHAYALNRVMNGKSFTYCRTEHTGGWAPVVGTGQTFTEPMSSQVQIRHFA